MGCAMRKPGIRDVPRSPDKSRASFDGDVKECLEIIMGRRGVRIKPLVSDASLSDVIAKVNEILNLVQE